MGSSDPAKVNVKLAYDVTERPLTHWSQPSKSKSAIRYGPPRVIEIGKAGRE
jgi:hypothetical protein